MSSLTPKNCRRSALPTIREKPVLTGSTIDDVGHVQDRSRFGRVPVRLDGVALVVDLENRFGPVYPRCIHAEAEPGPPLKEMTSGRFVRSRTSLRS